MKIYQCEEGEEEVGVHNFFLEILYIQNFWQVRKRMRGESMLSGEVRTPKRRSLNLKQEKREAIIKKREEEEEDGCIMQLELSTAGSITHILAEDKTGNYSIFCRSSNSNRSTISQRLNYYCDYLKIKIVCDF